MFKAMSSRGTFVIKSRTCKGGPPCLPLIQTTALRGGHGGPPLQVLLLITPPIRLTLRCWRRPRMAKNKSLEIYRFVIRITLGIVVGTVSASAQIGTDIIEKHR